MLNWVLGILCVAAWFGSFGWYFHGDVRAWLGKHYWYQRTLRMFRK